MSPINIDHMFHGLRFTKTASQINEKATKKVTRIKSKIEERTKRIADLRREYDIDDGALVQLLQSARKNATARVHSYTKMSNSAVASTGSDGHIEEVTIGAGVVNNLLTENDFIEAEKDQVVELELIVRNLKPIATYSTTGTELPEQEFALSKEDLKYLGF